MTRLNALGIIGGVIQIISPFLPWVSVLIFSISLFDMIRLLNEVQSMSSYWYTPPAELGYLLGLSILTAVLLIVGGIISFIKGGIGGALGIVGMLLFTVMPWPGEMPDIPVSTVLSFLGIGYYLGWIGCVVSLASHFYEVPIGVRAVTPPPPRTQECICPRCKSPNASNARFCRKCGQRL